MFRPATHWFFVWGICIVSLLFPVMVFADSMDIPIDQYLNFSSATPAAPPVTGVYTTGLWNNVHHYLLFKSSSMSQYNALPPGTVINSYDLKITDPTGNTGTNYLTQAVIWYSCGDPTSYTFTDVVSCGMYPQLQFAVATSGTTQKFFDYSLSDTLSHWIYFTGQTSGLTIDPAKMWWHVDYTLPTPTPTQAPKPGDTNNDGAVGEDDYSVWLSHFGQQVTGGYTVGDFNNDGVVDGVDYAIWLAHYGL